MSAPDNAPRALVVAKAPVAGRAKTRLAATVGPQAAAEVAAASLLDTLTTCREAFGPDHCLIALTGDLDDAVRGADIRAALDGWHVADQRGDTFAERLAHAHLDVPAGGPVVQVGMDTPQVTADQLREVARLLDSHRAVLGPADDGGWWVLGLRHPDAAAALRDVPMSTPSTYDDTRAALTGAGLDVGTTASLRDIDTETDAHAVADALATGARADGASADSEFRRAWTAVAR